MRKWLGEENEKNVTQKKKSKKVVRAKKKIKDPDGILIKKWLGLKNTS